MAMIAAGGFSRAGVLILLAVILLPVAAGLLLIHSVAQPPVDREPSDPADFLLRAEEIEFRSADGVRLSGWYVPGKPGRSPIVLCHDLGKSRSSLLSTAVVLNGAGFPVLLFDFRRHGTSGEARSTFGVAERLDLLAAVDFLVERSGGDAVPIGAWGIGMGAYAIALAASEREELAVIALDALSPDVPAEIDRRLRQRLPLPIRPLVPAARLLYNLYFLAPLGRHAVADRLDDLATKSVLLIAGADSPERRAEERALYEALPESPQGSRNLLELESSGVGELYAANRQDYDARIAAFFSTYLSSDGDGDERPDGEIEVLER
jgi:alpha-beta hydrolase superfamily lysophospholipase